MVESVYDIDVFGRDGFSLLPFFLDRSTLFTLIKKDFHPVSSLLAFFFCLFFHVRCFYVTADELLRILQNIRILTTTSLMILYYFKSYTPKFLIQLWALHSVPMLKKKIN